MENNIFSPMETDAIGEIMNISLGSSATAVSNMLDHRVDITTPKVTVIDSKDLTLGNLDPAVGVEIRYISGLEGSNFMLLKREDVKTIVDILMGSVSSDEEFELNELTISAVCEVMNQMMGAASTALSDFLGRMINISTPKSFELNNFDQFKLEHFPPDGGKLVVVRFLLTIEGYMHSEFVNVISVELARELIAGFGLEEEVLAPTPPTPTAKSGALSQAEIEKLLAGAGAVPVEAASTPQPAPVSNSGTLTQEEIERLINSTPPHPQTTPAAPLSVAQPYSPYSPYPPVGGVSPQPSDYPVPGYYPPPAYYYPPEPAREAVQPKLINAQPVKLASLDPELSLSDDQTKNLDLIMSVPLEVSVEIGRTRRRVQDILGFSKGSLVVLDKLAGDQVDLFVNGHCIAKGDVVVIDDNFGIRITEILNPPSPNDILNAR